METEWGRNCIHIDKMADELVSALTHTLNNYAPIKEKVVPARWANKKWYAQGMERIIRDRDSYAVGQWSLKMIMILITTRAG